MTINVDSVVASARRTLFREFVETSGADIIFVQETKTDESVRIFLPGFNVFRGDARRGWGGVALMVRDSLPVRGATRTISTFHAVSIECQLNGKWIRLVSCYMPHGISDPVRAFNALFASFPDAIIGGDFNARCTSFGDSSDNQYGLALSDYALTMPISLIHPPAPTCHHSTTGSFIDKFIFTGSVAGHPYHNAAVLPTFSDHCSFAIELPGFPPISPLNSPPRLFHLANAGRFDRLVFRDLSALDMPVQSDLADGDCEFLAERIGAALTNAMERSVPSGSMCLLPPPGHSRPMLRIFGVNCIARIVCCPMLSAPQLMVKSHSSREW